MKMHLSVRPSRRKRVRGAVAAGTALGVAVLGMGGVAAAAAGGAFGQEEVGHGKASGILLPTSQRVKPLGQRSVTINDGRLISSRLSPDGRYLATLSWRDFSGFVSILDVANGRVLQQVGTGAAGDPTVGDGTVAADGPLYSADGRTLWVSQTADLLRFTVGADGRVTGKPVVIPLTGAGPASLPADLPSGLALSADGRTLYAALNGANALAVIDTATNRLVRTIPVGIAPRQVVLVGNRAYVSNEGGRPTRAGDVTNLSDGTPVVSDPVTGAVNNGTVSVVDLTRGRQTSTIKVGLQPTAMHLRGAALMVANSNDDSVSIIDIRDDQVTQTFNVNPLPGSTVGSYPNAISIPDADHIVVSIGRDNALAVYRYSGLRSPVQYEGLIPTDWYPTGIQYDPALKKMVVTNDKGTGTRGTPNTVSEGPDTNTVTSHSTYSDTGTVTTFAPPTEAQLPALTHQVFVNNDWEKLIASTPVNTGGTATAAIPAQLGEPSKIKHVFLIVKENRTYDQVLGDIGKGNSDPALTQFGGSVTPNQHALANQYSLFDNFYDEGTLSADGHNWLMQADANDYIEKEFGAFYRSYPAQGGDALAYQRDGFLWNAAERAGKTVKDFGEYANFFSVPATGAPSWSDWYQDSQILEGKATGDLPVPIDKYKTYSDIPSLNSIIDTTYPRFDLNVPDQYRTDIWLKSFQQSEKTGQLADLNMLWVPDDHTSGTSGTDPYPTAAVADNDLAVGRIVDAISHSQFWSSSAVFVLEDDSQNGVDHIDGHRSPLYIASPYAKQGAVDHTYYTQLNVVKTIEQILGIAPMNQEDRAAEPMFDAFTDTADTTPFVVKPNQIPLTFGLNTSPATAATVTTAAAAKAPAASAAPQIPAAAAEVFEQWKVWSAHQPFTGPKASEDASNPQQLNHLDWYASTGWTKPYPGESTILGPYQVPGWDRPAADLG